MEWGEVKKNNPQHHPKQTLLYLAQGPDLAEQI